MEQYERIGKPLGEGQNGVVYLVRNAFTKQLRAMKEIPLRGADPEDVLREAHIGGQLGRHVHIVEVFDAEIANENLYVYSEYVRGIGLNQRIREAASLEIDEALTIFAQLLLGLEYAHQKDVAHLDIKPANLLLGEDGILKIADWGSAQILATVDQARSASTYPYVPPEYFVEEGSMGKSADLWAAGVVLYEMLTKSWPFDVGQRTNPFAWKPVIERGAFPSLVEKLSDPRANALQELVSRCLSPIETRFQRPAEVLDFMKAEGLYVLPLSEADYVAIDAFQSAVNRLQAYLEQSLAPFDWLRPPVRSGEKPTFYTLLNRWGALNDRHIADELHQFRLYRNDLAHGAQECREYRAVPSSGQIARIETLVEQIIGQKFTRYAPPVKAAKLEKNSLSSESTPSPVEPSKTIFKHLLAVALERAKLNRAKREKFTPFSESTPSPVEPSDPIVKDLLTVALESAQYGCYEGFEIVSDIAVTQAMFGDIVGAFETAESIYRIEEAHGKVQVFSAISAILASIGDSKNSQIASMAAMDTMRFIKSSEHRDKANGEIAYAEACFGCIDAALDAIQRIEGTDCRLCCMNSEAGIVTS